VPLLQWVGDAHSFEMTCAECVFSIAGRLEISDAGERRVVAATALLIRLPAGAICKISHCFNLRCFEQYHICFLAIGGGRPISRALEQNFR